MHRSRINNLKHMEAFRKQQRNHPTEAEAYLWTYLTKRKLAGKKFRRQFSIGNYIVDFICWEEKLAIELDGQHHYTDAGKQYDQQRDALLQSEGIRILRFENDRVFKDIVGVLLEIKHALTPSHSSPPIENTPSLPPRGKKGVGWGL